MKEFNKSNLYKTGGISKINISNFRSVSSGEDSQTLNLAPLTIVCGENSSGKSTLLNSILFLKQVLEDDSISSRGKIEVDLNGPLIQLGEYKNLANLKSDDREIKLEFDIIQKTTNPSKKLFKILFEMAPFIEINKHDPDDSKTLLTTTNFDFTIFENLTSEREWESLLEMLQNEKFYSSQENIKSEDKEIYDQYLENLESTLFNLAYQTEKLSFSSGGLDNKAFQTGNVQIYFNVEEEDTPDTEKSWPVNWKKCNYSLKQLVTNENLKKLRSKYPFLIPQKIDFNNSNYNNINMDSTVVNRVSDVVEEGEYESVFFEGGIPKEVMNAELLFKMVADGIARTISSIFSSKAQLKEIYNDIALDEYSSDLKAYLMEEPEYGEIEADSEGYIDPLDDPLEKDRPEKLDTEPLMQIFLSAISDLFYLEIEEEGIQWSFVKRWKDGLNLDLPYIENFKFNKELQEFLHAQATFDNSGLGDVDLGYDELQKEEEKAQKEYNETFKDFFSDLFNLLNTFDEDSRQQYLDLGEKRVKTNVKGDLERIILEEFSAIINEYEVSYEEIVDVFDELILTELSADILSNLYESLGEINKIIENEAGKFEYKGKKPFRSKDSRPTISEPIWFTKEPIGEIEIPEPKEIDTKLNLLSTSVLSSIKYIGPLRDLKNYEKRAPFFDNAVPVGLNGERFFNYFHEMKNNKSIYPLPFLITEHNFVENYESNEKPSSDYISLREAFSMWLEYFEIAQSFDTYYEIQDNNLYGQIKPLMLDDEIRMDSLGVGFSQLAPIILLCLNASEGDTIILEQPELHLHPSVQQKFGDFLIAMSEKIQIIVETHSDHMLNRIRRRVSERDLLEEEIAIYFAERLEGKTSFRLAELDPNGSYKLSDFPKGFFDQGAEDAFTLLRNAMIDTLDQNE